MIIEIGRKSLYSLIFFVWYTVDILSQTKLFDRTSISISNINQVIDLITLGLLVILIINSKLYINELITILCITLPVMVSCISSNGYKVISLLIFIVAARDIDLMLLIKGIYRILLVVSAIVIGSFVIGLTDEMTMYRSGLILRHSLGFEHPNVLGMVVFQIVICYVLIHDGQILRQMIAVFVGASFDYAIPNSQSPTILLVLLGIILPIYQYTNKRDDSGRVFRYSMIIGAVLANVLCIFATVSDFSRYTALAKLNMFLYTRFSAARRAFMESGVKLFGQVVYTEAEDRQLVGLQGHLYLDTAYATLLIRYGLIVYLIVSVVYIMMMWMHMKKRNDLILIILFIFSVYGIMESSMFMVKYNFLFLTAAELLYNMHYEREEISRILDG